MRLDKFIAHAGVCARRKATALILAAQIKVNNLTITQPSYQVLATDQVTYKGKILKKEKKIYILLNKPRDYITTLQDERDRKNVRQLIDHQGTERIYPVGRLDRNTTGLLLFTNHGDLARQLAHPSGEVQKVYDVTLASPIKPTDWQRLKQGLSLEDGFVQLDDIQVCNAQKTRLSLTLHIGKNRIIRRIFAHLGYEITRLDRTFYAGLTKKKLPIGAWRFLTEHEIKQLENLVKTQSVGARPKKLESE